MLFSSLFKNEKQIAVGRGRKRKLTIRDVVNNLDKLELTTANCTLIRDHVGNEKVEDYGQVDVFRVRDEKVFMFETGICITTPTGMKIKSTGGHDHLADIISEDAAFHDEAEEAFQEEEDDIDGEGDEAEEEEGDEAVEEEEGDEAVEEEEGDEVVEEEEEVDPDEVGARGPQKTAGKDAFSEAKVEPNAPHDDSSDTALGVGQVIRLRFFYSRIPWEIDCQILDRFNPTRFKSKELTPRFGVGYHVRPLSDARKRDQRRYIRYTHKIGFGHQRIRNEIQFYVYAHKTDLEIPEQGVLSQTLSSQDLQVTPYGDKEVPEVKGAEQLENIVEFFRVLL